MRKGLVSYLNGVAHAEATRALARLAIFSAEEEVRQAAVDALKVRRERDYTDILLQGLRYPLPTVAQRATDAIVKLERKDLVPELVAFLDEPDPRAPVARQVKDQPVQMVRELVRINHHRNCVLCHAPGNNVSATPGQITEVMTSGVGAPAIDVEKIADKVNDKELRVRIVSEMKAGKRMMFAVAPFPLTAQVPIPSDPLPTPQEGYSNSIPDILVRIDVTYLRQDFSVFQKVPDAHPWPEMQRFDFLVRSRVVTDKEAQSVKEELDKREAGGQRPYRQAALLALRELTGRSAEPNTDAWRRLLNMRN
jgi:hypothetical protein